MIIRIGEEYVLNSGEKKWSQTKKSFYLVLKYVLDMFIEGFVRFTQ